MRIKTLSPAHPRRACAAAARNTSTIVSAEEEDEEGEGGVEADDGGSDLPSPRGKPGASPARLNGVCGRRGGAEDEQRQGLLGGAGVEGEAAQEEQLSGGRAAPGRWTRAPLPSLTAMD